MRSVETRENIFGNSREKLFLGKLFKSRKSIEQLGKIEISTNFMINSLLKGLRETR